MIEDTRLNADALAWVQTLQARGVRLRSMRQAAGDVPKRAFKLMSVDERQTLKLHKAAIIAIVRKGSMRPPLETGSEGAACTVQVLLPRECIGEEHPLYRRAASAQ